ncbi:MAG: MFS transporter [Candidatus Roseilinea sp.]|nr:MAG: MFS transporter [Candidatus Roseilinea sp.]
MAPHSATEARLTLLRLAAIVAVSFGLTLISSTLEPALLGSKIIALVPDRSADAAVFGAVTFGGLIVAVFTQPLIGAWSDRANTRLGRRRPFMEAGAVGVVVGLVLIVAADSLVLLAIGLLLTQLGANSVLAAWQPVIAEGVPQAQRGLAAGFKAGFDLLAAIIGRLAAAELVSLQPEWGSAALYAAIAVPIAGLLLTLFAAMRAMGVDRSPPKAEAPLTLAGTLRQAFTVDVRAHPAFGWWFANRVLFWAGVIGSSVFLLFAARDVFGMSEAEAQRVIGRLIVVLGVALGLVIVPAGWLADRIGRRPMVIVAGLMAAAGAGLAVIGFNFILPAAILIGAGTGIYLSSSVALINDIVPKADAARYLGVANIATAGGSALARLGGGALISGLNRMSGSGVMGYQALYAVVAVLFLLSAVVMALAPAARLTSSPSRARASATAAD